jgi:hypothetical protein
MVNLIILLRNITNDREKIISFYGNMEEMFAADDRKFSLI